MADMWEDLKTFLYAVPEYHRNEVDRFIISFFKASYQESERVKANSNTKATAREADDVEEFGVGVLFEAPTGVQVKLDVASNVFDDICLERAIRSTSTKERKRGIDATVRVCTKRGWIKTPTETAM